MSGLDKIISQILDDADKEAKEVLDKARAEAEAVLSAAKDEVKKSEEDAAAAQAKKEKDGEARVKSSAELKKRQAVLAAKQQIIAELLDKAYESLLAKKDGEYFALLEKMLDRFVLAKEGEIYFSQKDLDRMPADFEAAIAKTAKEKGGALTLKKEPKKIDGGFILAYGGVEENCTFRALFSDKKEELSDKIHEWLFS